MPGEMILPPAIAAWGLCAALGGPATQPSTAEAPRLWGPSRAGLSASVAAVGDWELSGTMKLDFAFRSLGRVPSRLPPAKDVYGYLLIAQGKTIHYTERIFHARSLPAWPQRLGEGRRVRLPAVDVAGLKLLAYEKHLLLSKGYPARIADGKPQPLKPVGTGREVLKPGPTKIKYVAYLPRPDEGPISLTGRIVSVTLAVGDFARLAPAAQKSVLDDLTRRMRSDAWSAKSACADAARIGSPAVPALTAIVRDAKAPFFARMWSATALAEGGDAAAAPVLIECLKDSDTGLRCVAAYHGLKLRNAELDKALNARAAGGDWPQITAWALLGYVRFRKGPPPELVKAALESKHDRVRVAVAQVFGRIRPVPAQIPILHRLAADAVEQVRIPALMSLGASGDRSRATVDVLVRCLAMPGEKARHAAAGSLCRIAGKGWTYPLSGDAAEKQAVVRRWQEWWEASKPTWPAKTP